MLEDEEKQRIRQEELGKLQAQQETRAAQQRQRAAATYRAKVQSELFGKRKTFLWVLLVLPVLLLGAWFVFKPRADTNNQNAWGGITDQDFVARCQNAVREKLGDTNAQFPNASETSTQISATPDGKHWDGFVICPGLPAPNRADFMCAYTPQNDQLSLEIIKP